MEKIENDKNMIVLKPVGNNKNPGYTAVFMDLTKKPCRANIIGARQNGAMSLFIASKTDTSTHYTRLGQADKRSYLFDKNNIPGVITGAAIGRADSRGMLSMRFLEGGLGTDETGKNIYVKGTASEAENTSVQAEKPALQTEVSKTCADTKSRSDSEKAETKPDTKANVSNQPPRNETVKDIRDIQQPAPSDAPECEKKAYTPSDDEIKAEDTLKKIISDFSAEMKKLESIGVISSDETADVQTSTPKKQKNGVLSGSEKVFPFDNSSFDWVKGTLDDIWALGRNASRLYNAFVLCKECQKGYIIIGCPFDKSCVVIGIPCEYDEKDAKAARKAGFVDFWKGYGTPKEKVGDNFGYWIMNL